MLDCWQRLGLSLDQTAKQLGIDATEVALVLRKYNVDRTRKLARSSRRKLQECKMFLHDVRSGQYTVADICEKYCITVYNWDRIRNTYLRGTTKLRRGPAKLETKVKQVRHQIAMAENRRLANDGLITLWNSGMPAREIAEKLEIKPQGVYDRINTLYRLYPDSVIKRRCYTSLVSSVLAKAAFDAAGGAVK